MYVLTSSPFASSSHKIDFPIKIAPLGPQPRILCAYAAYRWVLGIGPSPSRCFLFECSPAISSSHQEQQQSATIVAAACSK